jgi:hypothetical protein
VKNKNLEKIVGLSTLSASLGTGAHAALVASPTIPSGGLTTPLSPGTIYWDIDNDGNNNFSFTMFSSSSYGYVRMWDLGDARVAGSDAHPEYFLKINAGAILGTANDGLAFSSRSQGRMLRTMSTSITGDGYMLTDGGWLRGDTGYFGFKFTNSGNTHYGWAEMTLSTNSLQVTINEAWYNDTPDGSVVVGAAVPEPAEVGLGLGVLALGAAGLRRMRQARKAA